jgi:hypothetical protein
MAMMGAQGMPYPMPGNMLPMGPTMPMPMFSQMPPGVNERMPQMSFPAPGQNPMPINQAEGQMPQEAPAQQEKEELGNSLYQKILAINNDE